MALFIGAHHIALDSTPSTNSYAKELLGSGKPLDGTLITATAQTQGRGMAGTDWQSHEGQNFTGSYILYPTFVTADKQFYLSMAASLAVKDLCEEITNQEICIKWPNDIYIGTDKVAGILIENTIAGNHLTTAIIGIGLNVNQAEFALELPNPTSLKLTIGEEIVLSNIIEKLSGYLEKYYLQLRQGHLKFLEKAYTEALYRYHHTITFTRENGEFRGQIIGVTKEGKLLIESGGKQLKFGMKEIVYR